MSDVRYAVYYAPPVGSALADFGAAWLGWDAEAEAVVVHPEVPVDVGTITQTPRKYGFHGTLKPPFRLAHGTTEAGLRAAIADLASQTPAFDAAPLVLRRLDRFLALVPSAHCDRLSSLAAACVQGLDAFRAPPSEGELARRQASGLTPEQTALLERWGYPYVLDAFRFHLTLTGALEPAVLDEVEDCLKPLTASFAQEPMAVHEICLFQQIDGAAFRVLHRYALTG